MLPIGRKAYTIRSDNYPTIIIINGRYEHKSQLVLCAHELGHALLHSDIINNDAVKEMKKYNQHYDCDCYSHCLDVAYTSYLICKKLKLDYRSAARAGMLHDFFLYDWRVRQPGRKGFHAFRHPYIAYKRASNLFDLNKKEKDI